VEVVYIPKKTKWDSLESFKKHLQNDTKEKITSFNGYELVTETTQYGLCDSQLSYKPVSKSNRAKKK
jgi:hypothetical protein